MRNNIPYSNFGLIGLMLIPHRRKQIAERCAIRNVTLLVRILDEFFQHHLILRRQTVAPRVLAKDFFLFF